LSPLYELGFALHILPRSTVEDVRYYVGRNPYWYTACGISLDINTPQDFRMARALYQLFYQQEEKSCG